MNDKCVVLNAKKMNFDGKLDFSILSSDVTVYDDTTEQQLTERIQGADIIVTKEMPVSAEMIQRLPESVKLICEAGTGYNNIDLEAARKKGITVCNIPAYSTGSLPLWQTCWRQWQSCLMAQQSSYLQSVLRSSVHTAEPSAN